MAEKRVSVRLVAEGGRQVRAELEGIGEGGAGIAAEQRRPSAWRARQPGGAASHIGVSASGVGPWVGADHGDVGANRDPRQMPGNPKTATARQSPTPKQPPELLQFRPRPTRDTMRLQCPALSQAHRQRPPPPLELWPHWPCS